MNRNRFLKSRLKFISAIATGAMIMSSILPYQALAADSNLYEVTENGERETIVTYESAAYFAVTIPKKITLDGQTKTAGYSITVRGDIPSDAKVSVSPKDQIPDIEGVNFYMEEQAITRKADVVATVVQEATEWASNEVTETGTAKNGSISAPDLTAGKWQGAFIFDINLIENSESHTHNYVDGVCTECGEKDPNAEVHTHTYTENITKEATCTETGEKSLTCECGDTKTESIPAVGHNYVDGICTECNDLDADYMPTINELKNGSEYNVGKMLTLRNNETLSVNGSVVPLTDDNTFTFDTEGQYVVTVTAPNGNEFTITITIAHTHNYEDGFCTICGKTDNAVFSQAGLYTATGKQLATWAELVEDYGFDISSDVTSSTSKGKSVLQGTTVNPNNSNYVLVVKDDVTHIGNYALSGCDKLKTIILPTSLESVGNYAFSGCSSLNSVAIPDGVTNIGKSAFYNCASISSVTIPDSVTNIEESTFECCTGLINITIPDSVTYIGKWAFYDCTSLSSVTIPDSITSIGYGVFKDCTGLDSVTIPNSVTSIGYGAFENCTGLDSITIPNSVTYISSQAFYNCTGLSNVTIQDSVTSIGTLAFGGVPHITYHGTATGSPWGAKSIN